MGRSGHFLDSCSLCRAPLRIGDEIYMYRGDTPFCTESCRQMQIDIDESSIVNENKRAGSRSSAAPGRSPTVQVRSAAAAVAG